MVREPSNFTTSHNTRGAHTDQYSCSKFQEAGNIRNVANWVNWRAVSIPTTKSLQYCKHNKASLPYCTLSYYSGHYHNKCSILHTLSFFITRVYILTIRPVHTQRVRRSSGEYSQTSTHPPPSSR